VRAGRRVEALEVGDPDEVIGVNTLTHLSEARWAIQARILQQHMDSGVWIEDPASTYIDHGVEIGVGTLVLPCTVIRAGVRVGAGCEVGPFTHLRSGAVLEDGAQVGNFTEVKSSRLGRGAKAKHLSYLGDADIGAGVNVGAGTIFANYDGVSKHRSVVGERAFLGSGTVVVGPNELGAGSMTGAGAVVTRSSGIGPGEIWVGVPARRLAQVPARGDDPADGSARGRE
jgi:bifunctional UDP-N-acetylglucosamine pyrophosphorylase / glucosamine-1-phosphate N-acetyltransferase